MFRSSPRTKPRESRLSAARIAIGYILIAGFWVAFSDLLMQRLALDPSLSTVKGVGFVVLTGTLLYFTIKRLVDAVASVSRERDRTTRLYRTVVETAGEGVCLLAPDGRITFANERLASIFCSRVEEMQGRNFEEWVIDGQPALPWHSTAFRADRKPQTCECQIRSKTGTPARVFLSATPLDEVDGVAGSTLAVVLDISEQKRLESELQRAQRLEALGRFAGGIVHDFNNLLSIVIGYCSVLSKRTEGDSVAANATYEIMRACERGSHLVGQLLAFSRKQGTERELVDVQQALMQFGTILPRLLGDKIRVEIMAEKTAGAALMGAGQLEQILINLATNARDAMPNGGELRIVARNSSQYRDIVRPSSLQNIDYTIIDVADTGTGIPPEIRSRIFEPFFSTKAPGSGTGLGLASVYGIVVQNGGWIDCDSTVGKGTQFRIWLPTANDSTSTSTVAKPEAPGSLEGNEVVLIVEDNASLRTLTNHVLSARGYTVIEAADGSEALLLLDKRRHNVDLVLTDLEMPGMSGVELAHEIRNRYPELPVALLSGAADLPSELANAVDMIQKPVKPDVLLARIRAILKRHSPSSAA